MAIKFNSETNVVMCRGNCELNGSIYGDNNTVFIGSFKNGAHINLEINGSNNIIYISESDFHINLLDISVGNTLTYTCNTNLYIGKNFQCTDARFFLYNPSNKLYIGEDCLFSQGITIRCGELPHLIFSKESNRYIDDSDGVFIGNHCWIGWCVYINKRASIPDNSIVGALSVVTHRFSTPNCVIAGNPAKEVKKGIEWFSEINRMQMNSDYYKNFEEYRSNRNLFANPRFSKDNFDNDEDLIESVRRFLLEEVSTV